MAIKYRKIKREFKRDEGINLIPFVGVFFILTIPFLSARNNNFTTLKVELPTTDYKIVVLESEPIKVYINEEGLLYVDNSRVQLSTLVDNINDMSLKNFNRNIYIIADVNNNYGLILGVVNTLRTNGYKNVSLVSGIYNSFIK
jgi:biopolymer transport protein ExbD